ncbi:hypothetical protein D9M71_195480 [compost metagenome]
MKIYHRTKIETAYKIVKTRQIWSKDPYAQANFHNQKFGGGSDCHDEITLEFMWSGTMQKSEPWPASPNVLHWTSWEGAPDTLFTLALFPGTSDHLTLVGVSNISPSDNYPLSNRIKEEYIAYIKHQCSYGLPIQVPTKAERISWKQIEPNPSISIIEKTECIWRLVKAKLSKL